MEHKTDPLWFLVPAALSAVGGAYSEEFRGLLSACAIMLLVVAFAAWRENREDEGEQ